MLFKSNAQTNQQIPRGQRVKEFQGVYNVFGKEVIQNYVLIYAAKGKITVQRKVSSLQARMVIAASMPEGTLSPEFSYMKDKGIPGFL